MKQNQIESNEVTKTPIVTNLIDKNTNIDC